MAEGTSAARIIQLLGGEVPISAVEGLEDALSAGGTVSSVDGNTGAVDLSGIYAGTPAGTPATALVTAAGLQTKLGGLALEVTGAESIAFDVSADNGAPGIGLRSRIHLENNQDATDLIDLNFRQVSINIGDKDPDASTAVSFDFYVPTGASSPRLRFWRPGDSSGFGTSALSLAIGAEGDLNVYVGGRASYGLRIATWGQANPKFEVSETGKISIGPGGATAMDVSIERTAANILAVNASWLRVPTLVAPHAGLNLNLCDADGNACFVLRTTDLLVQRTMTFGEGVNFDMGETTGTKIGLSALEKWGTHGATPSVQGAAIADAAGGGTVDTEARAAINALLAFSRTKGFIAA